MVLKSAEIRRTVMLFSVLCMTQPVFSQHHISKYELCWAFFHPFAAIKIKKQLPVAMEQYKLVKQAKTLDEFENGGKLDAFRHSYTMAFLARSIKSKKLKKLGKAHEKGNKRQYEKENLLEDGERPDSLACEMDLRNNAAGIDLGRNNRQLSNDALRDLVIQEINNGKMWYLKRNAQKHYVNCQDVEIDFSSYTGKWYIPKCLIKTSE